MRLSHMQHFPTKCTWSHDADLNRNEYEDCCSDENQKIS